MAGIGAVTVGMVDAVLGTDPPTPNGAKVGVELVECRSPEDHGMGCGPVADDGIVGTLLLDPACDALVVLANGFIGVTPGGTEPMLLRPLVSDGSTGIVDAEASNGVAGFCAFPEPPLKLVPNGIDSCVISSGDI